MKILFVYPGIARIGFRSFDPEKIELGERSAVPLGLGYLAYAVEKRGFETDILDLRYITGFDEAEQVISDTGASVIGISVQTPSFDYAVRIAAIAKRYNKIVIAGGIHATVVPSDFLKGNLFDHIIKGAGEISLVELLEGLALGKKQERVIQGKEVQDLDQYPYAKDFPLYSRRYRAVYDFEFTRGCFGKCTYCVSSGDARFGRTMRSRSVDSLLVGIDYYIKKYQFSALVILDDNATSNRKNFNGFCQRVSTLYPDLTINLSSRVDCFTDETARSLSLFKGATVWFGFESNSPRILRFLRKNVSVEQNYRALNLCKKYRIEIGANVLVGVPTEREEDISLTYDFIREARPDLLHYNVLSPHPGTWIYDYCKEKRLLKPSPAYEGFDHVEGLVKGGLIKGVDYNLIRSWWPRFDACAGNYDSLENGILSERVGEFDRALKEYEKASFDSSKSVRALFHSGSLLKRQGRWEQALASFGRMDDYPCSVREREYFAKRHFHRGEMYSDSGDAVEARKEFRACISLLPSHEKANACLLGLDTKKQRAR